MFEFDKRRAVSYCEAWCDEYNQRGLSQDAGFWLAIGKLFDSESIEIDSSSLATARACCHSRYNLNIPEQLPETAKRALRIVKAEAEYLDQCLAEIERKIAAQRWH
ncbi:MAG: hypothetical protein AAGB12_05130 [Pseudomonadota bacterium]